MTSGGYLTATSGKFGSLSVNSGGNTTGSYHGSLSGCGGSVSSGLSYGGTYSTLGGMDSTLYNTVLRVGTIEANYVKASTLNSGWSFSGTVSASTVYANSLYVGGQRMSFIVFQDGNGNYHNCLGIS